MKVIAAGLMLLTFVPAARAQSRGVRHPDLSQIPAGAPTWGSPDPLFPPPPRTNVPSPLPIAPVSVNDLRIPPKAAKELERSQKAFQSGDLRASADHLEKAVQIYPDFVNAHNLLGLRYLQLGAYEKGYSEFQKVARIDPNLPQTNQNLSFALLLLHRYTESEAAARRSLEGNPELVLARYCFARAVIGQGRITPEVLDFLRQSESTFPNASLVLAQIHYGQGNLDQVAADLRHYLQAPSDADNKHKAECWLAQLTNAPAPPACPSSKDRPNFD